MLALVTVVAVLLSIRRDSIFIALLGLVGGFSTPALLSTGRDNPFGLFGYLLLLNAGLGWVAYRKRWPALVGAQPAVHHHLPVGLGGDVPHAREAAHRGRDLHRRSRSSASSRWDWPGERARSTRRTENRAGRWFEEAASLNGALPLLFALFMAGSPAYGDHPALLFGFLLCVDAGLFAVALWRRQMLLHVLGAVATLVVFATWMSTAYVPTSDVEAGGSYPLGARARQPLRRSSTWAPAWPRATADGASRARAAWPSTPRRCCCSRSRRCRPSNRRSRRRCLAFAVLFGLLAACAVFAIAEVGRPRLLHRGVPGRRGRGGLVRDVPVARAAA